MTISRIFYFLLVAILISAPIFAVIGCGDDDDDDADDQADDDITPDDDSSTDDDVTDDDVVDDDQADDDSGDDDLIDDDMTDDDAIDDDTVDDDTSADLYVAPWPQANIEVQDYDETGTAGPLREKVVDYDAFNREWHQPYYGGCVSKIVFTDETRTEIDHYDWWGDSTMWTGTYLVSQAMRYYVTGDEEAKANAIRAVEALDRHLHVTGRTGFIGRYTAPKDAYIYEYNGGDAWCDADAACHRYETGPYAGDWWQGETSRDQYVGWFFGMATAYDLLDDEDTRDMIVADVAEVLDELIAHHWIIIDVNGLPSLSAPNMITLQQLNLALIGYHMTGEERYKAEVQNWIADERRSLIQTSSISANLRYGGYFPNNLNHQTQYTLLRLAKVYLNPDDYNFLVEVFENQIHTFTRLSHNPFFNAIFMSQGLYTPGEKSDPYQEQLEEDLTDFRAAPMTEYYVDPEDTELDPVSVMLHDLIEEYPFLEYIFGNVDYQSLEAHPVLEQCTTDFLWQRNPFRIEPCGSDKPYVTHAGVDYLVAYWMASYHKFITKEE